MPHESGKYAHERRRAARGGAARGPDRVRRGGICRHEHRIDRAPGRRFPAVPFRLFPSKKALFLATVDRCFDDLGELFERAAGGRTGEEALEEMGRAYNSLLDNREIQEQLGEALNGTN
jgi:hypothetical protein